MIKLRNITLNTQVYDRVKVGDKIRITRSTWNYKVGAIGKVEGIKNGIVTFTTSDDIGTNRVCGANRGRDDFIIIRKNKSVVDILNDT